MAVSSIRIGKLNKNSRAEEVDKIDEKPVYQEFVNVDSARVEPKPSIAAGNAGRWREPTKRILKDRTDKEVRFAAPKIVRPGNWKPVVSATAKEDDNDVEMEEDPKELPHAIPTPAPAPK